MLPHGNIYPSFKCVVWSFICNSHKNLDDFYGATVFNISCGYISERRNRNGNVVKPVSSWSWFVWWERDGVGRTMKLSNFQINNRVQINRFLIYLGYPALNRYNRWYHPLSWVDGSPSKEKLWLFRESQVNVYMKQKHLKDKWKWDLGKIVFQLLDKIYGVLEFWWTKLTVDILWLVFASKYLQGKMGSKEIPPRWRTTI